MDGWNGNLPMLADWPAPKSRLLMRVTARSGSANSMASCRREQRKLAVPPDELNRSRLDQFNKSYGHRLVVEVELVVLRQVASRRIARAKICIPPVSNRPLDAGCRSATKPTYFLKFASPNCSYGISEIAFKSELYALR